MTFPVGTRVRNRRNGEVGTVTGEPLARCYGWLPVEWDDAPGATYYANPARLEIIAEDVPLDRLTATHPDPVPEDRRVA